MRDKPLLHFYVTTTMMIAAIIAIATFGYREIYIPQIQRIDTLENKFVDLSSYVKERGVQRDGDTKLLLEKIAEIKCTQTEMKQTDLETARKIDDLRTLIIRSGVAGIATGGS